MESSISGLSKRIELLNEFRGTLDVKLDDLADQALDLFESNFISECPAYGTGFIARVSKLEQLTVLRPALTRRVKQLDQQVSAELKKIRSKAGEDQINLESLPCLANDPVLRDLLTK